MFSRCRRRDRRESGDGDARERPHRVSGGYETVNVLSSTMVVVSEAGESAPGQLLVKAIPVRAPVILLPVSVPVPPGFCGPLKVTLQEPRGELTDIEQAKSLSMLTTPDALVGGVELVDLIVIPPLQEIAAGKVPNGCLALQLSNLVSLNEADIPSAETLPLPSTL